MTYNVFGGTVNLAQSVSINECFALIHTQLRSGACSVLSV